MERSSTPNRSFVSHKIQRRRDCIWPQCKRSSINRDLMPCTVGMQAWLHHLELASPTRRHVWFDSRSEAGRCVLVDIYIFRDSLAKELMSDPWQIHVLMILKRTHKYPPKSCPPSPPSNKKRSDLLWPRLRLPQRTQLKHSDDYAIDLIRTYLVFWSTHSAGNYAIDIFSLL